MICVSEERMIIALFKIEARKLKEKEKQKSCNTKGEGNFEEISEDSKLNMSCLFL